MSNPSNNTPIKINVNKNWFIDINRLTPDEALMLAKHKYKPGDLIETPRGGVFVAKDVLDFEYVAHHNTLYLHGMVIFDFSTQQWARVKQRAGCNVITKTQKQHLINLIKSI